MSSDSYNNKKDCQDILEEYRNCIRNITINTDNSFSNHCFLIWNNLIICNTKKEDKYDKFRDDKLKSNY